MWKYVKKYKNRNKKKKMKMPNTLYNSIKESLNTTHHAFIKEAGMGVEFECETIATRSVFRMFPRGTYRWTLNDGPLTMEPERMVFRMGNLVIQGLRTTDTGLYSCRLHYTEREIITVAVFSLYVKGEYDPIEVNEGRSIRLECNAYLLGILYPAAAKEWYHNGDKTALQDIPARNKHRDVIEDASPKREGNWTCVVYNPYTKKSWTTAFYNVKILPPLTVFELILEYVRNNVKNSILIMVGFFSVVMVISSIFIDMVDKKKKQQDKIASKIQYKLLEDSGCGFYDNEDNLCYTDKDGKVVVCEKPEDENEKGATSLADKVKNAGKAALEKTKNLIEGSEAGSNTSKNLKEGSEAGSNSKSSTGDDENKNAADVSTTQTLDSFSYEDDTICSYTGDDTVSFHDDSLSESSCEESFCERRPLLSLPKYHVTFR